MENRPMTFGEIFRGIADGDVRLMTGFTAECLIMAPPFLLFAIAIRLNP